MGALGSRLLYSALLSSGKGARAEGSKGDVRSRSLSRSCVPRPSPTLRPSSQLPPGICTLPPGLRNHRPKNARPKENAKLTSFSSSVTSSLLSFLFPSPPSPPTLVPSILKSLTCPLSGAIYSESVWSPSPADEEEPSSDSDEAEEAEERLWLCRRESSVGRAEVGEEESVGEKREGTVEGMMGWVAGRKRATKGEGTREEAASRGWEGGEESIGSSRRRRILVA